MSCDMIVRILEKLPHNTFLDFDFNEIAYLGNLEDEKILYERGEFQVKDKYGKVWQVNYVSIDQYGLQLYAH